MSDDYDPQEIIRKLEQVQDGSLKLYTRDFAWPYTVESINRNQGTVMLKHTEHGTVIEPLSTIYDVYHFTEPVSKQETIRKYTQG